MLRTSVAFLCLVLPAIFQAFGRTRAVRTHLPISARVRAVVAIGHLPLTLGLLAATIPGLTTAHASTTVWVGGSFALFKSDDQGGSWSDLSRNHIIKSLFFLDDQTGWAGGYGNFSGLMRTMSAGQQWTDAPLPTFDWINDVHFVSYQNGWAVDSGGNLLKTSDWGSSWTVQAEMPGSLHFMLFTNASSGCTGGSGGIWTTEDDGTTWINRTTVPVHDVFFLDANTGWAVGLSSASIVLKTVDGGATWSSRNIGVVPLNAVWFVDSQTGFAVGNAGHVVRSVDGGATWVKLPRTTQGDLNDIAFDGLRGWIVGDAGAVLTTTDGGATWATTYPTSRSLETIHVVSVPNEIEVQIETIPRSLDIVIDGLQLRAPLLLRWIPGALHELTAVSPQKASIWSHWSDGGERTHVIAPMADQEYAAYFDPPKCPQGSIVHVDARASEGGDGVSWTTAFNSLQTALTSLAECPDSEHEIWVAAGTYKPTNGTDRAATFQLRNGVALYGGFEGAETERGQRNWAKHETILSGDIGTPGDEVLETWKRLSPDLRVTQQSIDLLRAWTDHAQAVVEGAESALATDDNVYHVVTAVGADESCVLDGFTVSNGGSYSSSRGGGMLIVGSSPRIENTVIRDNTARVYGGGIAALEQSHPFLANVSFSRNRSGYVGGGMLLDNSAVTIRGGEFVGNWASIRGGGLAEYWPSEDAIILVDVEFRGNMGDDVCGGMSVSKSLLVDVVFDDNWTQGSGGGLLGSGTLINVLFRGNAAVGGHVRPTGGGGGGMNGQGTLIDVAFIDNVTTERGGGLFGGGQLVNVTCVGNTAWYGEGGGIFLPAGIPTTCANTIAWGNESKYSHSDQILSEDGEAQVSYSLIQRRIGQGPGWDPSLGRDGGGNILGMDPRFVDPAAGNYRLLDDSPAIDSGSNAALPSDVTTDLDGNPRFSGRRVDRGAWEHHGEAAGRDLWQVASAKSPVTAVNAVLEATTTRRGIQLWWRLTGTELLESLELRRASKGVAESVVQSWGDGIHPAGTLLDAPESGTFQYRLVGRVEDQEIASPEIEVTWDAPSSSRVELLGASPNPFNPSTTISLSLPEAMRARLDVYDLSGRHVVNLVNDGLSAGLHHLVWNGEDDRGRRVASGSYFCRLTTPEGATTQRLVVLK